ncbi:histidinol-phosphate aminotransferase [Auriculariales sp. MPI-PUGE-AT-0066]|nr:histidinol-phosphate aminotransferase [Auriculariales sp. MPI-PUGE-AT-0066]
MPIHGLDPVFSKGLRPAHFDIERVIRPNILALHPYRCARDDYSTGILLDANENALGHAIPRTSTGSEKDAQIDMDMLDADLHRYPDPGQVTIKRRIAELRFHDAEKYNRVFLGVGSDEALDLIMRVCCIPGKDRIMTTPPTYGMYGVCAQVNDVEVVKVPLQVEGGAFQLQLEEMKARLAADPSIKLVMVCSPGNPTGTVIPLADIRALLDFPDFKGIVVVDEAYIDFAPEGSSAATLVEEYANVCVLQTLSKSFGLAAIRVGIALAQPAFCQVLFNTKAPYNIATPSSLLALKALSPEGLNAMKTKCQTLIQSRTILLAKLAASPFPELGVGAAIGGNAANFILVPLLNKATGAPDSERAIKLYKTLAEERGVVVRYRGGELGCAGCLRITIGSEEENLEMLKQLEQTLRAF